MVVIKSTPFGCRCGSRESPIEGDGAVVFTGDRLECLDESAGIWAVPVHRLLG